MKKSTLSMLMLAVVLAPLTALAQKNQSQNISTAIHNSIDINPASQQINHNAYGVPLASEVSRFLPDVTQGDYSESNSLNLEIKN